VFESIDRGFITHLNLVRAEELDLTPGPAGLSPWAEVAGRLEPRPFIIVASIRGRARGSAVFVPAMDVLFAAARRRCWGDYRASLRARLGATRGGSSGCFG
jgi:hypothetical protein